ncbi:cyclophilin-like family protein [Pelotomaculum propionicicum]|uniref:cyclophilin-like family protein n=1 Tax=Pelotomaculum propionicicum TaxID=258475 RepID=UPI0010651C41
MYFSIPVDLALETEAREEVAEGDLGYWPTGRAFCIFFGRTPASRGGEIRAASAVNIFGRVVSNLDSLYQVADGADIVIEQV